MVLHVCIALTIVAIVALHLLYGMSCDLRRATQILAKIHALSLDDLVDDDEDGQEANARFSAFDAAVSNGFGINEAVCFPDSATPDIDSDDASDHLPEVVDSDAKDKPDNSGDEHKDVEASPDTEPVLDAVTNAPKRRSKKGKVSE